MKPSDITTPPMTSMRGTPGVSSSLTAERLVPAARGAVFVDGNMNHSGSVSSAGMLPTRNIGRQVCSSVTNIATPAASMTPIGQPAWSSPEACLRQLAGIDSIASAVPRLDLRAHAEAEQGAEDEDREERVREVDRRIERDEPHEREHQRQLATPPIGHPAGHRTADEADEQRQRQRTGDRGEALMELAHQLVHIQRDADDEVERIEDPARPRRSEGGPLRSRRSHTRARRHGRSFNAASWCVAIEKASSEDDSRCNAAKDA